MENLLETAADIDLNYPDDDGRTPLLPAALHDRSGRGAASSSRGARTPRPSGAGPAGPDGPLATAAATRPRRHMDALLEGGASANAATGPDGRTPLIAAAEAGNRKGRRIAPVVGAAVDGKASRRRDGGVRAAVGGHGDVSATGFSMPAPTSTSRIAEWRNAAPLPGTATADDTGGARGRRPLACRPRRSDGRVARAMKARPPRREERRAGLRRAEPAGDGIFITRSTGGVARPAAKRSLPDRDFPSYVDAGALRRRASRTGASTAPRRRSRSPRLARASKPVGASEARDAPATADW